MSSRVVSDFWIESPFKAFCEMSRRSLGGLQTYYKFAICWSSYHLFDCIIPRFLSSTWTFPIRSVLNEGHNFCYVYLNLMRIDDDRRHGKWLQSRLCMTGVRRAWMAFVKIWNLTWNYAQVNVARLPLFCPASGLLAIAEATFLLATFRCTLHEIISEHKHSDRQKDGQRILLKPVQREGINWRQKKRMGTRILVRLSA